MDNYMDKARTGRADALKLTRRKSGIASFATPPLVQFKSSRHTDPVSLFINRTQVQTAAWLH
jgi:hypothetical protein